MRNVIVGFSRPKRWNLLSWLIMKVQKANYSHVYIKFYSPSLDREIIYQASGLQVNFIGSKLFNEHHVTVHEFQFPVSDESHTNAMRFAVDKAGSPYSIKQLFSILLYLATGKVYFRDGRSAYVCSELIGQMLTEDLKIPVNKDLDLVVPRDIYEILLKEFYG